MAKRITRSEVAKMAGVSPSTVSRALNDHPAIGESTKERIRKISQELGYTPSQLSRSYYQNKSFRLGVVIPFFQDEDEIKTLPKEYFSKVLLGATHRSMLDHFSINLIPDQGLQSEDLYEKVNSKMVDGLIMVGSQTQDERFIELQSRHTPFVLIHHYDPKHDFLYVDIDPLQGMDEAMQLLKKKKVQSCSFVSAGEKFINSIDRLNTFKDLCKQYEIQIHSLHHGDYSRDSGAKVAKQLLKGPLPDALLCANDRMAYGALETFKQNGVQIPAQLKIIGFDNQAISQLCEPQLTTIENPFYKIGQMAADILIRKLSGENVESQKLSSKLICRDSA